MFALLGDAAEVVVPTWVGWLVLASMGTYFAIHLFRWARRKLD